MKNFFDFTFFFLITNAFNIDLCLFTFRTLGLDGNGLRALRPATIAKGTEAVLAWLRNKIV